MLTLDEILRNPVVAASLPPGEAARLVAEAGAALAILAAHLAAPALAANGPALTLVKPSDKLLTIEQAARVLHKSTRWFYRNRHRLPWVHPAGPKSYLINETEMRAWLAEQRASVHRKRG